MNIPEFKPQNGGGMTQNEYDCEMKRLNDEMYKETHKLRLQLQEINRKNTEIKTRICELKMQQLQYSNEYHTISDQIHSIKQKYNDLKHQVYLQRPDRMPEGKPQA